MNVNNNRNYNPVFQARLNYGLAKDVKRWEKIAAAFEEQTTHLPNYDVALFQDNKGQKILSTFDGNLEIMNKFSEEGYKKLDKLSDNSIVNTLKRFLNITEQRTEEYDKLTGTVSDCIDNCRPKKNEFATAENTPAKVASAPYISPIHFGALHNISPKKFNIEAEISKIRKQIDNLLENDCGDVDIDDFMVSALQKALGQFRARVKRQDQILEQLEWLGNNQTMNSQEKMNMANSLHKEFQLISKKSFNLDMPKKQSDVDEKTDFQLINKFKSSVSKGNFNLLKVYKEHYAGLKDITSLEELGELYPKIKVPPRPEKVIAKKIVSTLTRDFYETMDDLCEVQNTDGLTQLLNSVIGKSIHEITEKFNVDEEFMYIKIADDLQNEISDKFLQAVAKGFSSVPTQRKVKTPPITALDVKLLSVDFDDFVLSVLQRQYLDMKKPNEIVYSKNGISIPVNSLSSTEYKFAKPQEKAKQIAISGNKIEDAKRAYENFSNDELKARLNYYAGTKIGNNEEILDRIIAFDSCMFMKEDITALEKFLKNLDDIYDGKISLEEGIDRLKSDDLRPKGTEILDELEKQKAVERFKLEQQQLFKLNELQDEFDDAVNHLYMNNLTGVANTCSKYKPNSLDAKEKDNADFIIRTIKEHLANDKVVNKTKLEASISRWDTYNYYESTDAGDPLLKQAKKIAQNPDGSINKEKAGQYIINAEIIHNYPNSAAFVLEPKILEKIMEKAPNKEEAIKYMIKFDDYTVLPQDSKSKISVLADMFDAKDPVEKSLLKHIVENDYVNSDTNVLTKINDKGSETVPAGITSEAKQQVLAKYKYPICMEYFKGFESALNTFTNGSGFSGIKRTGSNNEALEYKMELKLKGKNDRLFSSKNNYIFDIYSDLGLH